MYSVGKVPGDAGEMGGSSYLHGEECLREVKMDAVSF